MTHSREHMASPSVALSKWPMRPASIITDSSTIRAMPLGDSITLGYPDNVGGWRPYVFSNHPTLWSVGTQIDGTGFSRSEKHEGFGGRNSASALAGVATWYGAWPAGVVLLQLGTNDIGGGSPPLYTEAEFSSQMLGVINTIKGINAAVKIFLGKVPYAKLGTIPASMTNSYRAALSAAVVGVSNLVEVDFPQLPDAGFADMVHPNAVGYASMAATWSAALTAAGY